MEGARSVGRPCSSGMNGAGKAKHAGGNGSKGRGRPRKLSYLTAAARKVGRDVSIGDTVVVRRNDGLLYYGEVLRVEETNDRCQIRFEDGVTLYTLFKDIHQAPGHGEASCCVCNSESTDHCNPIIVCDSCSIGYHQCCHNPPIAQCEVTFFCQLCCFVASVKQDVGRLFPLSTAGSENLRHVLPYKMNLLTWDAQHRTNVEQCYCYCGGPGDWHSKMLQCCRCRQWFHEACIQCLQHALLYGDCFFMFVCSHCNQGQEYIKRLSFRWVDVAQLALFNLTLQYGHKYYDLDDILLPWIHRHLSNLHIHNLLQGQPVTSTEVRSKVEAALNGHRSKFMSGREVKKKHTLWGLILRIPPNAPSVVVPLSGPINSHVLSNPHIKGRKTKHVLPTQCQSPVPLKYLSRCSLDPTLSIMSRKSVAAKVCAEANNNNLTNGCNSQCYNQYNGVHPGPRAKGQPRAGSSSGHPGTAHNGHLNTSDSESSEEEDNPIPSRGGRKKSALKSQHAVQPKSAMETTVCKMEPQTSPAQRALPSPPCPSPKPSSLDCLVKTPPNFSGLNHPFRTEIEKQTEKRQLKHFEARMAYLKKEYAGELAALKLAQEQAKTNPTSLEKSPAGKSAVCAVDGKQRRNDLETKQRRSDLGLDGKKRQGDLGADSSKHRRGVKRKAASEDDDLSPGDCVRRSQRSRMNAERYQHLLDSFPRHLPKPEPGEGVVQRWRWKSVVDQLRFGEKFQIRAWRQTPGGQVHFLLDWDDEN